MLGVHSIMFDFSCKNTCSPSDPATATVKIDPAVLAAAGKEKQVTGKLVERWEAGGGRFVEVYEEEMGGERLNVGGVKNKEAADQLVREFEQEKKRREDEKRKEAERVAAEAEEARLAREREEQEALERARAEAEENERLQREELERARVAREEAAKAKEKAERERLEAEARAAEEKARKLKLASFLKLNGFTQDPKASKKVSEACGLPFTSKTVYPIHVAAEQGDATILELIIQANADPTQKTSGGKTALELAQKKSKGGSHDAVVKILGGKASSGGYGGASS